MPHYRFDVFALDTDSRRLWKDGVEIELQPRPFDLLSVLLAEPGRVWRRDELFAAVWPRMVVTDSALTQAVFELRRAMGEESRRVIRTVARSGYAIDVPVTLLPPRRFGSRNEAGEAVQDVLLEATAPVPVDVADAPPAVAPAPESAAPGPHDRMPPGPGGRRRVLGIAAAVGAVLMLVAFAGRQPPAGGPVIDRVRAFQEVGSAGTSPWIAGALEQLVAREAGIAPRPDRGTLAAGASELSLQYAVSGEPGARRVRVAWSLSQAGRVRRAGVLSAESTELVMLAQRIAAAVGRGGATGRRAVVDEAALRAFAAGAGERGAMRLADARRGFEQALARAPSFVHARAELADVLWLQGYRELARAEAARALQDLGDGAPTSRLRADLLAAAGRQAEAAREYATLAAAPDADPMVRFLGATALLRAGDPDAARGVLDGVDPRALAPQMQARWHLVDEALAAQRQDLRAALDAAQRAVDAARSARDAWTEGRALASMAERRWRLGDIDGSAAAIEQAHAVLAPLGQSELLLQVRFFDLWIRSAKGILAEADIAALQAEASAIGNADLEARVAMLRGAFAERGGRYEDSARAFGEARAVYARLGDRANERVARYNAAVQRAALGELSTAAVEVAEIRDLPPIGALPVSLIDKTRGWILYEAGRYGEALAALDPAIDATAAQDAPLARTLRCVRGRVHAVRGDHARAAADFDACAAPPDAPIADPDGLVAAVGLARLAAASGDADGARRQLDRALATLPAIAGEGVEEALAELALALARLDPVAAPPVLDALAARPEFAAPSLFRTALRTARCGVPNAPGDACDPASIGLTPDLVRLMAWRSETGDRHLADER